MSKDTEIRKLRKEIKLLRKLITGLVKKITRLEGESNIEYRLDQSFDVSG